MHGRGGRINDTGLMLETLKKRLRDEMFLLQLWSSSQCDALSHILLLEHPHPRVLGFIPTLWWWVYPTKWACGVLPKSLSQAVNADHENVCLISTAFPGNFSRSLCLQRALLEERGVRKPWKWQEVAGSSSALIQEVPPLSGLSEQ